MLKCALPKPLSVPVPRTVVPSIKVTEPSGLVVGDVTVAVNVMAFPAVDGFFEDTMAVVEVAFFTTSVNEDDVLFADSESPL